jgi:hypothetical protein
VATRAESEAAAIAADLRAQATRRERLRQALDPRPLFTTPSTPPREREKVPAGV